MSVHIPAEGNLRSVHRALHPLVTVFVVFMTLSAVATGERLAVASYPVLVTLIEELGGGLWQATYIVPPGVDPHEYSLGVEEVFVLSKATLLVVTNHTHFEERVLEMWRKGLISPKEVVVVEEVEGIRFLVNPVTGKINPHLPYYDPENLVVLARDLASRLRSLDPANSEVYEALLERYVSGVQGVTRSVEKRSCTAAASTPLVQYAVEWAGVRIEGLLEAEHEVPSPPSIVAKVLEGVRKGRYDVAVVMAVLVEGTWRPSSRYDEILAEEARKAGVPLLFVPDPFGGMTNMRENLRLVAEQLRAISCGEGEGLEATGGTVTRPLTLASVVAIVAVIAATILARKRWRGAAL